MNKRENETTARICFLGVALLLLLAGALSLRAEGLQPISTAALDIAGPYRSCLEQWNLRFLPSLSYDDDFDSRSADPRGYIDYRSGLATLLLNEGVCGELVLAFFNYLDSYCSLTSLEPIPRAVLYYDDVDDDHATALILLPGGAYEYDITGGLAALSSLTTCSLRSQWTLYNRSVTTVLSSERSLGYEQTFTSLRSLPQAAKDALQYVPRDLNQPPPPSLPSTWDPSPRALGRMASLPRAH